MRRGIRQGTSCSGRGWRWRAGRPLNAAIIAELEADLPTRHLDDGRSVEEALAQERRHLRAMPAHRPATCRVVPPVTDVRPELAQIAVPTPTLSAYDALVEGAR